MTEYRQAGRADGPGLTCGDPARDREVIDLLRSSGRWAGSRPDIRGVALVGSWARGAAGPSSDVDLITLTTEPNRYVEQDDWIASFGHVLPRWTRQWGPVTERRLVSPTGLEIELGFATAAWAATDPIDPGTLRVASDGIRPIYDPDESIAMLVAAVPRAH